MTDDIFKYIDVERTIAEFGYDPRELKPKSAKKVHYFCLTCKSDRGPSGLYSARKTPFCASCSQAGRVFSEETRKKMSCSSKGKPKNYVRSNETRQKMSAILKGRVFSEDTRKKMSKAKVGKPAHNKGIKGLSGKNHPRYGKPAAHGKGSWYVKKDGTKVWMRSTWEVKYAKYLDDLCISWEIEAKPFPVTYEYKGEIKEGNYWPDFVVNGEWFEIKAYWRDDAKPKFEAFKAQYPDEKITLLMKPELLALGIEL